MSRRQPLESAMFFLAVAGAMSWLAYAAGDSLPQALLPLYRRELQWLMDGFRVDYLDLQEQGGETVLMMQATLQAPLVIMGRILPAGGSVGASTLAMHAWAHPVLLFSLLAAWPGVPLGQKPRLLLIGVPWVLLAESIDIPLVLWGSVEDILYWQVDPAMTNPPPGSAVQHALDGGGRYGMTILFSLFAVMMHQSLPAGTRAIHEPAADIRMARAVSR